MLMEALLSTAQEQYFIALPSCAFKTASKLKVGYNVIDHYRPFIQTPKPKSRKHQITGYKMDKCYCQTFKEVNIYPAIYIYIYILI